MSLPLILSVFISAFPSTSASTYAHLLLSLFMHLPMQWSSVCRCILLCLFAMPLSLPMLCVCVMCVRVCVCVPFVCDFRCSLKIQRRTTSGYMDGGNNVALTESGGIIGGWSALPQQPSSSSLHLCPSSVRCVRLGYDDGIRSRLHCTLTGDTYAMHSAVATMESKAEKQMSRVEEGVFADIEDCKTSPRGGATARRTVSDRHS